MDLKVDTLVIFLILLPGFVSSTILDSIVTRRAKDVFGKVVEALVFSFIIYGILVGIFRVPLLAFPPSVDRVPQALTSHVNSRFILGALTLSLLLPLVIGLLTISDRHMRLLRWLGISRKSSRDTVWLDVFIEQKRYVIVNLSGQRRLHGWPMYYSETQSEGLLYLHDPAWVNEDGTYRELGVHGIFLVERDSIESIDFTKIDAQKAENLRS